MKRIRKSISIILVALVALLPLPGCVGNRGGEAVFGSLAQLALGIGASVGTYFLIKELQ